ncbi:MAG: hypothetical protein HQK51_12305 [Oligoflexia bacterium]|nr:hypothetical protein [Oligoflexia bacterium]
MLGLKQSLKLIHTLLNENDIDHALIGGLALATLGIKQIQMTFDEYLDFLDEYWEIFGPIPPRKYPLHLPRSYQR